MNKTQQANLKQGIISVVQTPFMPSGEIDFEDLENLVEDAMQSGVDGFLAPAVASEVESLTQNERVEIVRAIGAAIDGKVSLIVGASSDDFQKCRSFAALAQDIKADAYLVAVPEKLYREPDQIQSYFETIAANIDVPLVIQDLEWHGPGLEMDTISRLKDSLPTLVGLKIETVPAGPKYTAVRDTFGPDFFVAGGWAVQQWIEALDRGIDAMMPESSMIRVYAEISACHRAGKRDEAVNLFRRLLPILAFTNQEIDTSIAFFKRLLVQRGIFTHATMRKSGFVWDKYNTRIADELIELYLALEASIA